MLTRLLQQHTHASAPFRCVVLAHASASGAPPPVLLAVHSRIATPSAHIIGLHDPFKSFSEAIARHYVGGPNRLVLYHGGRHELPVTLRSNTLFDEKLRAFLTHQMTPGTPNRVGSFNLRMLSRFRARNSARNLHTTMDEASSNSRQGTCLPNSPRGESSKQNGCASSMDSTRASTASPYTGTADRFGAASLDWRPVSAYTSIACVPGQQLVRVRIDHDASVKPHTFRGMLGAMPPDAPCLRDARVPIHVTTYGTLLKFISPGGGGDLSVLGVRAGDVVAYAVPPGAIGAVAFLMVASQAVAAPLDATIKLAEAKSALLQFKVQHVIFFEGLASAGLRTAVEELQEEDIARGGRKRISVHTASPRAADEPGMFDLSASPRQPHEGKQDVQLSRSADDVCLLLRTSGTTSMPKGVPLRQGQLVRNALLLGSSFQLTPDDICLNVMPLFHIGGLSGSILASLAAGAQISCLASFSAVGMVDALAADPRPTWYSAVPTIHMLAVKHFDESGIPPVHSLRFIRSGAAALSVSNQHALSAAFGGIPVLPTYSMSEQMPISQPPVGTSAEGTVGVPVAASVAIVDPDTLMPQPPGVSGAIAISGPTVMTSYLENPSADARAFFLLSCGEGADTADDDWFFDTGDLGMLDAEGQLSITGRGKELIKRGGEQLSPYEVEEAIVQHPWVRVAVVFSVESELWGEEPGVAIVLSHEAPPGLSSDALMGIVRTQVRAAGLAPFKRPVVAMVVNDADLPRTTTHKYIRIGLARVLHVPKIVDNRGPPHVSAAIVGVRYFLACFVVFNHVGKTEDDGLSAPSGWRSFANARLFCIHMPCFFILAGFSLSQTMSSVPKSKFRFFVSRFSAMYPMYVISIILMLISFLITCNPSTYVPTFSRVALVNDTAVAHFCEPPPMMVSSSWGASFAVTLVVTFLGLQAWPFAWPFAWWISYYAWFSSVYYFCVLCHPWLHGWLMRIRGNKPRLLMSAAVVAILNSGVILGFWLPFVDIFDERERPGMNSPSTFDTDWANWYSLGYYLFPLFWLPVFAGGVVSAFIFDAFRPYASQSRRRQRHFPPIVAMATDAITVLLIALSVTTIVAPEALRPVGVEDGDSQGIRTYAAVMSRIYAPLLAVWLYAMAAGHGLTAWLFAKPFMVNVLAPTAYNIYIFHQWVGQMYWWVTRNDMWSYWRYRKDLYWFSPKPVPVNWWEYPFIVILATAWAMFMNIFNPQLILWWNAAIGRAASIETTMSRSSANNTALGTLLNVVTDLTGLDPDPDSSILECGIHSFGLPVLLHLLKAKFPGISLTVAELIEADTLREMGELLAAKANERVEAPPRPTSVRYLPRLSGP